MKKTQQVHLKVKANIELADGTIESLTLSSKRDTVLKLSHYADNENNAPHSVEIVVEPRFPKAITEEFGDALIGSKVLHCYKVNNWFDMLQCAFDAQMAASMIDEAMNNGEPMALIELRLPVHDVPSLLKDGRAEMIARDEVERIYREHGVEMVVFHSEMDDEVLVIKVMAPDNPILAATVTRELVDDIGFCLKDDPTVSIASLNAISLCTDLQDDGVAHFKVKTGVQSRMASELDSALEQNSSKSISNKTMEA